MKTNTQSKFPSILLRTQLFVLCMVICINGTNAQIKVTNGPVVEYSSDLPLYDFSGCDASGFCIYRATTKDDEVEKYNKQSLLPESKFKIDPGQNARSSEIEKVIYAQGKIFIFRLEKKKGANYTYFMQTCAVDGHTLAPELEVFTFNSKYDDPYLQVLSSPTGTKLFVNIDYSQVKKEDVCELVIINTANSKRESTVHFPKMILQNDHIYPDDAGNIYFTQVETNAKPSADGKRSRKNKDEEKIYRLTLYNIAAGQSSPLTLNLPFDDEYILFDSRCCKKDDKFLIIGGFYRKDKAIDKKTTESMYGIYSFKVDIATNSIVQKSFKRLDDAFLAALNMTSKDQQSFKLDDILLAGNDIYFTGEQYSGRWESVVNDKGMSYMRFEGNYYDAVIAKLNENLEFTWIRNVPLRFTNINATGRLYKQFIPVVTERHLYIVNLDYKTNFKTYTSGQYNPAYLESGMSNLLNNFVCHTLSLKDGSIKDHRILLENKKELAIYNLVYYGLNEKTHELFIRGGKSDEKDRFVKVTFE
jgi:hypothetical protein